MDHAGANKARIRRGKAARVVAFEGLKDWRCCDAPPVEAFAKGVRIVRNQFLAALEALGLERFDPSGEPFDPTCHEAVSVVPAASAEEDQRVQHVLRSGYRQGEHVLRPAMVVVGRWDAPAD